MGCGATRPKHDGGKPADGSPSTGFLPHLTGDSPSALSRRDSLRTPLVSCPPPGTEMTSPPGKLKNHPYGRKRSSFLSRFSHQTERSAATQNMNIPVSHSHFCANSFADATTPSEAEGGGWGMVNEAVSTASASTNFSESPATGVPVFGTATPSTTRRFSDAPESTRPASHNASEGLTLPLPRDGDGRRVSVLASPMDRDYKQFGQFGQGSGAEIYAQTSRPVLMLDEMGCGCFTQPFQRLPRSSFGSDIGRLPPTGLTHRSSKGPVKPQQLRPTMSDDSLAAKSPTRVPSTPAQPLSTPAQSTAKKSSPDGDKTAFCAGPSPVVETPVVGFRGPEFSKPANGGKTPPSSTGGSVEGTGPGDGKDVPKTPLNPFRRPTDGMPRKFRWSIVGGFSAPAGRRSSLAGLSNPESKKLESSTGQWSNSVGTDRFGMSNSGSKRLESTTDGVGASGLGVPEESTGRTLEESKPEPAPRRSPEAQLRTLSSPAAGNSPITPHSGRSGPEKARAIPLPNTFAVPQALTPKTPDQNMDEMQHRTPSDPWAGTGRWPGNIRIPPALTPKTPGVCSHFYPAPDAAPEPEKKSGRPRFEVARQQSGRSDVSDRDSEGKSPAKSPAPPNSFRQRPCVDSRHQSRSDSDRESEGKSPAKSPARPDSFRRRPFLTDADRDSELMTPAKSPHRPDSFRRRLNTESRQESLQLDPRSERQSTHLSDERQTSVQFIGRQLSVKSDGSRQPMESPRRVSDRVSEPEKKRSGRNWVRAATNPDADSRSDNSARSGTDSDGSDRGAGNLSRASSGVPRRPRPQAVDSGDVPRQLSVPLDASGNGLPSPLDRTPSDPSRTRRTPRVGSPAPAAPGPQMPRFCSPKDEGQRLIPERQMSMSRSGANSANAPDGLLSQFSLGMSSRGVSGREATTYTALGTPG
eukprot:Hpha_TRINITY_DN15671_c0_g1::TRINITY_DN15671_c0_g1_i4::g.97709::m.97709